jgi:hypothetical protein
MDARPHVRWKTFDELEASLREFERLYATLPDARKELRDAIIRAKDRARYASRNAKVSPGKRAEKAEMVQWMLVWLDDPSMFAEWVRLRRKAIERSPDATGRSAAGH